MRTLIDQQVAGFMDRLSLRIQSKTSCFGRVCASNDARIISGNRISGVLSL